MALSTEDPTIFSSTVLITSTQNQQSSEGEESATRIIIAVVLFLMIIATVFGNTLVLIATWLEKRLHEPNKYFIACLAVADLLVGIFSIPIRVYLIFRQTDVAVQLCGFWAWVDICCEVASISTLTVISVDRYIKISRPFKYKMQITSSRSLIVICFIWLISAAFATLGQFSHGGSQGVGAHPEFGCYNDNMLYYTVVSVVSFFFPTLIIITVYILIFFIVHKRHKMARKGALGQSFASSGTKKEREFRQEWKTIRMLALIVLTFIICWGPFFILLLLMSYNEQYMIASLGRKNLDTLEKVFNVILPSFNSLCNPIIYACLDREYSKTFKQLFQQIFHSKGSSRDTVKYSKSPTQIYRQTPTRSIPASEISQENTSNQAETCLL